MKFVLTGFEGEVIRVYPRTSQKGFVPDVIMKHKLIAHSTGTLTGNINKTKAGYY